MDNPGKTIARLARLIDATLHGPDSHVSSSAQVSLTELETKVKQLTHKYNALKQQAETSAPIRLKAFYRLLARVGEAGQQRHSDSDFLQAIVDNTSHELQLPLVALMRYDGRQHLTISHTAGERSPQLHDDMPGQWPLCPLTRNALYRESPQVCLSGDNAAQQGYLQRLFKYYQLAAIAAVPVHRHGRVWAVLLVSACQRDYFNEPELELLARVSNLAGRQLDEYDTCRALVKAREIAEQANLAKSEFLTRISHELRTPMNAIMGFAQVLQTQLATTPSTVMPSATTSSATQPQTTESSVAPPSTVAHDMANRASHLQYTRQIIKAGCHLLDLINEALSISRIETGRLALNFERVDVDDLLNECRNLIAPRAKSKNIQLKLHSTNAYIYVDPLRCRQVILNLLSNAVNYNRPNGSVDIQAIHAGEHWRIAISDTGPGIASDDIKRIFQPFERLGREYSDEEGVGIGLALSQRLTELMHGRLEVDSTPGHGATFSAIFPAARHMRSTNLPPHQQASDLPARQRFIPVLKQPEVQPSQCQHWRILYVEDHLANFQVVATYLQQFPQFSVVQSKTTAEARKALRAQSIDLVLLDLRLHSEDGMQLLTECRPPRFKSLPIIVVTADASNKTRKLALANGAYAYLSKPLDLHQLHQTMLAALADHYPAARGNAAG